MRIFSATRVHTQRERERRGVVYCGWSGTLWLKGGRMFAKRVDLDTIILYR